MTKFRFEKLLDVFSSTLQLIRIGCRAFRSRHGAETQTTAGCTDRSHFLQKKKKRKWGSESIQSHKNIDTKIERKRTWRWRRWESRGEDRRHLREERESEEGEGVEDEVEKPSRALGRRREEAAAAPLREAICGGVRESEKASAIGFHFPLLCVWLPHSFFGITNWSQLIGVVWLWVCFYPLPLLFGCFPTLSCIFLYSLLLTKHSSAWIEDLTTIVCFSLLIILVHNKNIYILYIIIYIFFFIPPYPCLMNKIFY